MTDAESRLAAELDRRVNPEKSRNFSNAQFEQNLERLQTLADNLRISNHDSISIVGTNGKGSTAFFLANEFMTRRPGSLIGLYTSPHLQSFLERIRISGVPVSAESLWETFCEIQNQFDLGDLSYFELLTILCGHLFEKNKVPVRIYEAGLGGRLDATRIFRSKYVILTAIALDHEKLLGNTIEKILTEKLGIISDRTELLLAMPQIERTLGDLQKQIAGHVRVSIFEQSLKPGMNYLDYNRAFAAFCHSQISGTPISRIATDAAPIRIPGRLEIQSIPGKTLVFDVAHNPASFEISLHALRALPGFPAKKECLFVFGVLKDRDPDFCVRALQSHGFMNFIQVRDATFADALPNVETINLTDLPARVQSRSELWIVFLGSHRLYHSFLAVRDLAEKMHTVSI